MRQLQDALLRLGLPARGGASGTPPPLRAVRGFIAATAGILERDIIGEAVAYDRMLKRLMEQ